MSEGTHDVPAERSERPDFNAKEELEKLMDPTMTPPEDLEDILDGYSFAELKKIEGELRTHELLLEEGEREAQKEVLTSFEAHLDNELESRELSPEDEHTVQLAEELARRMLGRYEVDGAARITVKTPKGTTYNVHIIGHPDSEEYGSANVEIILFKNKFADGIHIPLTTLAGSLRSYAEDGSVAAYGH